MKKPTIKETLIESIETDDLDFVVEDELLGPSSDGHDAEWIRDKNNQNNWEEHISVKMLEGILGKLKAKGATYIQIDSNHDHHSYEFTGTKLEVVTEKEVNEKEIADIKNALLRKKLVLDQAKDDLDGKKAHFQKLEDKLKELEGKDGKEEEK